MQCAPVNTKLRDAVLAARNPKIFHKPRQCEHIKVDGEFCGSPALRGRRYCYFHLTYIGRRMRAERLHTAATQQGVESSVVALQLPPLEDANSIQIAYMQMIDAILHNRIDPKRAGLVLYALQSATQNLANGVDFRPRKEVTSAGRYEDFEQDFQLGDATPELRQEEDESEKPENQHQARMAEMRELSEAVEKLKIARKEAGGHNCFQSDEEGNESFECCDSATGFFCSIIGPLAPKTTPGESVVEWDAPSQRLEMLPVAELSEDTTAEPSRKRRRCGSSG